MLKFACILPHPPIIIPTIGSERDRKRASKTIEGMQKIGEIFKKTGVQTVLIISPHGPLEYSSFSLNISPRLKGNFLNFGDPYSKFEFENDLEMVDLIKEKCKLKKIPYHLIEFPHLDHGVLVPLYYLLPQPFDGKIVPLTYSFLGKEENFEFGKVLKEVIDISNKKVGVVASGDLSHCLSFDAPAGFSPYGEIFDRKIVALFKNNDIKGILEMDKELIEKAGECGYLSIVILLGIISSIKGVSFEVISYEAPFGVGYLVLNVRGL
jgi:aromatic ring-opening dioxygenase LigB subunit